MISKLHVNSLVTILSLLFLQAASFQMMSRQSFDTSRKTYTELHAKARQTLNRRKMVQSLAILVGGGGAISSGSPGVARAYDEYELEDADPYNNPNMPAGPEERSGLVILRVAEVCNFQEKIIRAVVNRDIDTVISPQQIVFGNQVMLRNSNIAGNMKLMIDTEIPRKERDNAIKSAVVVMNTLQSISIAAGKVQRPFTDDEMIEIADLYRVARVQLNNMYEYLPPNGRDKYYGYFMQVTEYEKKIAEGVYNPELDGVLKLEYD